jgi:hypothetical protein
MQTEAIRPAVHAEGHRAGPHADAVGGVGWVGCEPIASVTVALQMLRAPE